MVEQDVLLQLELIGVESDDIDKRLAKLMIRKAQQAILNHRYPFGYEEGKSVESRYYGAWIEISVYLYNKLGAEGQKYHKEGEVSRGYDESYVPNSMLRGIIPIGGVPFERYEDKQA